MLPWTRQNPCLQEQSEQTTHCLLRLAAFSVASVYLSVKWTLRVGWLCKDYSPQYEGEFKSPGWRRMTNNQCVPCHLPQLHIWTMLSYCSFRWSVYTFSFISLSRISRKKYIRECRIKKNDTLKNDLIAIFYPYNTSIQLSSLPQHLLNSLCAQ